MLHIKKNEKKKIKINAVFNKNRTCSFCFCVSWESATITPWKLQYNNKCIIIFFFRMFIRKIDSHIRYLIKMIESTILQMNEMKTKEKKKKNMLRKAFFELTDGFIQPNEFGTLCDEIETNLYSFKDDIVDFGFVPPEYVRMIIPDKNHPVHRLHRSTNCSNCHEFTCYILPCDQCGQMNCAGCNTTVEQQEICPTCIQTREKEKENTTITITTLK